MKTVLVSRLIVAGLYCACGMGCGETPSGGGDEPAAGPNGRVSNPHRVTVDDGSVTPDPPQTSPGDAPPPESAMTACDALECEACADCVDPCASTQCDPNADCFVRDAAPACVCRAGYAEAGAACEDIDECTAAPGPCGEHATCTNTEGSFACTCAPGFALQEGTCQNVDDCDPNPCERGGTCMDGVDEFTCVCREGRTGERCELEICSNTTITSRADLEANRLCTEIRGWLRIGTTGLSEIGARDLPYLTKVTGDVQITFGVGFTVESPLLRSVTLTKLQEITGSFAVAQTDPLRKGVEEVHLPALTSVGTSEVATSLAFVAAGTRVIDLPELTTVHGQIQLSMLDQLCSVSLPKVEHLDSLDLGMLPGVPPSTFAALKSIASAPAIEYAVGCCFPDGTMDSCPPMSAEERVAQCGCEGHASTP